MTTNPTPLGWTRGTPSADGVYWWKRGKAVGLGICEVVGGDVFIPGASPSRYVAEGSEFLGPITPAGTERLVRLEKATSMCKSPQALVSHQRDNPKGWEIAIKQAEQQIRQAEERVRKLKHSIEVFRESETRG